MTADDDPRAGSLLAAGAHDRPLWLHFLPLDTRRVAGVATRLSDQNQFALLRWLTLISSLIAKEFCIINVGTIEESDISKAVLADALPLIERGLIRFSMRENDFLEQQEKKEREYRGTSDWYADFKDTEIYRLLNAAARIVPRTYSIGDSIAERFADEQFFAEATELYDEGALSLAARLLPEAAEQVRNAGLALTWPQIKKGMDTRLGLQNRVGLPLTLTAYFDANRLKRECCILGGIPFFEHADRVVSGVPSIDIAKLIFAFRKYGILNEMIRLTSRGVCLLREKDEFPALRSILLADQGSAVGMSLGGAQVITWVRSSVVIASTRTLATIHEDDRRLLDKIKDALDSQRGAAVDLSASARAHPLFRRIIAALESELIRCEDYIGETRIAFERLILHLIAFCRDRLDASRRERGVRGEYLSRENASEWDLQCDLHQYLQGNYLEAEIRTEVEGIGTGRADILVSLGSVRFPIELKRAQVPSLSDIKRFLPQASAYQAANVRLSVLGVLDISERTGPPPHLEENFWIETILPKGAQLPSFVVCFRVPGRLLRPSNMTRQDK